MTKKKKQLIILLGLLIIAVIAVTAFALIKNAGKEEEPVKTEQLISEVGNIKKIVFNDEDTLVKEDDGWVLEGEGDFPLDPDKVKSLVKGLETLAAEDAFKAADELSAYGLEEPGFKVKITGKKGTEEEILFGKSLDGGKCYLKTDLSDNIYIVSEDITEYLDIYLLAELKEIKGFNRANITSLTINGKKLNEEKEKAVVSCLEEGVKFTSFINNFPTQEQLNEYGLINGTEFYVKNEEGEFSVTIGNTAQNGGSYVLYNERVYTLSKSFCDAVKAAEA